MIDFALRSRVVCEDRKGPRKTPAKGVGVVLLLTKQPALQLLQPLQLELPDDRAQELKKLMAKTGADTYKDLFNNALSLFEWGVGEAEAGRSLAAIGETGRERELAMPALDRIRRTRRAAKAGA